MVEMQELSEQIAAVVREFGKVEGDIAPESDLYSEVGVESVNSIAILFGLEERFSCTIDDNEFIQARTLTALTQMIRKLTEGNN